MTIGRKNWIWVLALMVMVSCHVECALAQTGTNVQAQDNPFESVLKKQRYASVQGGETLDDYDTGMPQLSVETITLQYVDAQTASEAFSVLCSEVGQIVPRESGNSLIVFDTPDNIEKVVAEIKKADRPIESMMLQYVAMEYMDANSVKDALVGMLSPVGTIVAVEKTNGVILCDSKTSVESMVKEIERLDRPMAGMQVRPITFQHVPASSAMLALTNMLSRYGTISIIERTNTLVICDLSKNLEEICKEAKVLDGKTPGLVVETVNLKFLQAKNMALVLQKMLSQYGTVVSNDLTETVIISDTEENVARIVREIKKVDKTPPQIMVEAVLLNVSLDDDKEIGVDWEVFSSDFLRRQNDIADFDGTVPWDPESNVGVGAGFDAINGGVAAVASGTVSMLVTAIQSTRNVEIIASPRALLVSGKVAQILANEEIPYEERNDTSAGGSMTSTSFKEVGVTLQVSAVVADANEILLTVDIEQSVRTGESLAGVPVVVSRQEDTTLLLQDGQVVVMGGLRRREKSVQVTKVPILGDLPLLGNLFRTSHDIVMNSELVVLLSPHIYKGDAVPEEVRRRYRELKDKSPLTGAVSQQLGD